MGTWRNVVPCCSRCFFYDIHVGEWPSCGRDWCPVGTFPPLTERVEGQRAASFLPEFTTTEHNKPLGEPISAATGHPCLTLRANAHVRGQNLLTSSGIYHLDMIGQYVDLCVDMHQQVFVIRRKSQVLKQVPIKGLQHRLQSFEEFAALMCKLALS